jgi:hypothetical protein
VQHELPLVQTPPSPQLVQLTVCPQLFMAVVLHLPAQAESLSGKQHVLLGRQTPTIPPHSVVPLAPQATTWPQLFVAAPQFIPAHVVVAGSGSQPQEPAVQVTPPSHDAQITVAPQLS